MIFKTQDKEYILKFDINALVVFEETTGLPISRAMNEEMGIKTLRSLLYAGLTKNNKLTMDEVGDIMQGYIDEFGSMDGLNTIIQNAFAESNLSDGKK